MHIYFSGIGGTAIGPLALIAKQAGYQVSGSDKQNSNYIKYLKSQGIDDIHIGQTLEQIQEINSRKPIDWYVYTSALTLENPNPPELIFCKKNDIKISKRDELLNKIISDKQLKLVAIAGTHGKTTTTAMAIWLFKELGIPVSYSVGAKISFGEMGQYNKNSEYFIYEADEFDRNFLQFKPYLSIISGIDYDHPDIYPTRKDYYAAFNDFLNQSQNIVAHPNDMAKIGRKCQDEKVNIDNIKLVGEVNRKNAQLVVEAVYQIINEPLNSLIEKINRFPGVSRRFEQIIPNLYSDYAHTPEKIKGALQTAQEAAGKDIVVIYEGLHNTRQHFIKNDLLHLFDKVKKLYVVPSYLAREDESLELLTSEKLIKLMSPSQDVSPAILDNVLKAKIQKHLENGDLVLCLSAGGGGSLDEWIRQEFVK